MRLRQCAVPFGLFGTEVEVRHQRTGWRLLQLLRRSHRSSRQDETGLVGTQRPGIQPEIVQPERSLFFPIPDRAEANEDICMTKDTTEKFRSMTAMRDVQANYVASRKTVEAHQEAFKKIIQSHKGYY